jgi:hypothetical protein
MSKPTTYRGIPYTITKGVSLRPYMGEKATWHGIIGFEEGAEHLPEQGTKRETKELIEKKINIRLDYEGDDSLYRLVENLIDQLIRHDDPPIFSYNWLAQPRKPPATVSELCRRLHKTCEIAERILRTRHAESAEAALIEKLRAMTVANGCTPGEAANARAMLQKLEGVA